MATGMETAVARAAARALTSLTRIGKQRVAAQQIRAESRAQVSPLVAAGALAELTPAELAGLEDYLDSPEFEEVALQAVLAWTLRDKRSDELRSAIREQVRAGLRLKVPTAADKLLVLTDLCCDALFTASDEKVRSAARLDATGVAAVAPLVAAAATNGLLLGRIPELSKIYETADRLRDGIARKHADIRLPHAGVSKKVPYAKLYVEPPLIHAEDREARRIEDLLGPGLRGIVLGAPGAGKSSLLAKLAHDIAADRIEEMHDRVPFLVILRDFVQAFSQGGMSLLDHLERLARDPYNVHPPADGIEYLLRNGRGVVLLDGLDELVDQGLRRRVVDLVEGFAHQYPLVPILATARAIGYAAVPLDPQLFDTYEIGDFTDGHVAQYARLWFLEDEATAPDEKERITDSFVADSRLAGSLRHSPLLLSLLCAMYSSARYIPRNLAQVYERCAVMLFDEWDTMRGIAMPMQFQGRLRSAVQYLAWRQLTATQTNTAMPRNRVLGIMAEYLRGKKLDPDDAAAASEGFLDFCTGRAWILADVGSTAQQSTYDFTHRTFMEFFAAEHLVRTHDSGPALWQALRGRIASGDWDVVGQICLQLIDRNRDDGAESFLEALLSDYESDPADSELWLLFACKALGYVVPSPSLVDRIIRTAFDKAAAVDADERHPFWILHHPDPGVELADVALNAALESEPLEGNVAYIRRTMLSRTTEALAERDSGAVALLQALLGRSSSGDDLHLVFPAPEDVGRLGDDLQAGGYRLPTLAFEADPRVEKLSNATGPDALYRCGAIFGETWYPPSLAEGIGLPPHEAEALSDYLIAAPRPWVRGELWFAQHKRGGPGGGFSVRDFRDLAWPYDLRQIEATILTFLPYLETAPIDGVLREGISRFSKHLDWLINCRVAGAPPPRQLIEALRPAGKAFIWEWIEGRISTIG